MKTLDVTLPGGRYPIHIGAGLLDEVLPRLVGPLARELVVVVTNETLQRLYPDRIEQALRALPVRVDTIALPDGEQYKTLETLARVYDRLMAQQANRRTLIIAFGGGVVGDMAGFAAATFMRGVPLVQVPTTLLAQVDSSVGGKTAVNHRLGKNAIGAFKQPDGVVMELELLATLPDRELRAGLFELIKHGIIRDPELFTFLEGHRDRFGTHDWGFWEEAVWRSCRVKAAVVEADERETDLRAILNFGHSLGHLIETHTGYAQYLHGEAVGVGMLFAAHASWVWGELPEADSQRIRALLQPLVTPVRMPVLDAREFAGLLMHDKKAAEGVLRFIGLRGIGQAHIHERTAPADLWPLFRGFLEEMPGVLRLQEDAAVAG
ncbi:MAG TPA: 3-dehydroquinate synthase [bacterium]|nr:3-dehydroquinate synthase [bacterium]